MPDIRIETSPPSSSSVETSFSFQALEYGVSFLVLRMIHTICSLESLSNMGKVSKDHDNNGVEIVSKK